MSNPEFDTARMRQWATALRSGNYTQTRQRLHRFTPQGHGYCCLGVACDISGLGAWEEDPSEEGVLAFRPTDLPKDVFADSAALPDEVASWLGFETVGGFPSIRLPDGEKVSLSSMNDHGGLTFVQIAEYIEDGCDRVEAGESGVFC